MYSSDEIVSKKITTVTGVLDFLMRTVDLARFQLRINSYPLIENVSIPVNYANMHSPRMTQMPNYSKKITRFQLWGIDAMQREVLVWERELQPLFKDNFALNVSLCTPEAIRKELK